MLTRIKVKNYKGFKEAEIPIKPITVLLGANSSGKSSMLQLLLLLQQTAEEATESYKSALKIFGNRISIGKPDNLFYGLNRKVPVHIQIDFNNEKLKDFLDGALLNFLRTLSAAYFGPTFRKVASSKNREEIVNAIKTGMSQTDTILYFWDDYSDFISEQDIQKKDSLSLIRTYDFLTNLRDKTKSASFTLSYTISYYRKNLVISAFSLKNENSIILSFDEVSGFSSEIINLNVNEKAFLNTVFFKNSSIFSIFEGRKERRNGNIKTSLEKALMNIIKRALSELRKEFKEPYINHVSPLRAHPQRYYMLDKANVAYSLDTYDANAIAEVIKDKPILKSKVNEWFKQFGLEVDIDEFKEAIHKLTVSQSGLSLDIPDVGFGVSQVLPVVLQGFLSPDKSITIVEQPEVHLHPQMQGALADLFIDITKEAKYTKHLIIETHSEYLLKRLRRRMAERETITSDKVSINLFHSRTEEAPATIDNLSIEDRGAFEWPEEYYGDELYNDTVVFLKLQGDGDLYSDN